MTSALLSGRSLSWQAEEMQILADVDIDLAPGEVLGLIGPNGAGKSSLLRLLARLRAPSGGELRLDGQRYVDIPRRRFHRELAYLEQRPRVEWALSVRQVIELGRLPWRGLWPALDRQGQAALRNAIAWTGLRESLLDRAMDKLSEGERVLVTLARLLAAEPRLLLADEPVAALDPQHQLLILELFQRLVREQRLAGAVIVLHDLTLAARFCDRLLLLHEGRVAAAGAPAEVLTPELLRRCYGVEAEIREGPLGLSVQAIARVASP